MGFNEDLAAGAKAEKRAIPLIRKQYKNKKVQIFLNPAGKLEGKLNMKRRGDIFDSFGIRWEVKWDRQTEKTGNVFVEHVGLLQSGSDYVLFFLDTKLDLCYMISRDLLLAEIEKNKESKKYRIVPRGMRRTGGMGNEGTLFSREFFEKMGKLLK